MRTEITPWTARGMGLAFGVLLVYGLVQLGVAAGSVLILLLVAILIASGLTPMISAIRTRTHLGRGPTILLVYATFLVTVVVLVLIVVPAAIKQAEDMLASLPQFVDNARQWAATLRPPALARSTTALIISVGRVLQPAPPTDPEVVAQVGTAVAGAAVTLATLLVMVFFWLTEHARLQRYVLSFVPAARRRGARRAWNEVEGRMGMWVRGQLILMGTIGLATGTLYSLLGLPGAVLLGLIAAISEAIPIIGPLIGAVPAVLVAASVSPELALVVAFAYLIIQAIEGSVLVPLVMRNTVGISPLLILVSLLVGEAVGGVIGALLAVPLAASGEIVLSRLQARTIRVAQDPAATTNLEPEEAGLLETLPIPLDA